MIIVHVITGLDLGGAETALYRLVSKISETDTVSVVSLRDDGVYAKRIRGHGVPVHSLGMPKGRVTFRGLVGLYRFIKGQQPDVVQTWMYHADLLGGIIARLAGIKAVIWGVRHANLDSRDLGRSTYMVVRMCAALSRWIPSRIVSCSKKATELHKQVGYMAGKFVVIPNGYDLERLRPDANARSSVRASLDIPGDTFVIGMVARYHPLKDHNNLFGALSLLRNSQRRFVCCLIGPGMTSENEELVKELRRKGIEESVRFLGPRSDIVDVMNALDIHVLSSAGEAFPNVLAEAMACGIPCVSTDAGDSKIIVGDTGWIVPRQNSQLLATAITTALECWTVSKEWKQRKAMCRTRIAEKFSLEKMKKDFCMLWSAEVEKGM